MKKRYIFAPGPTAVPPEVLLAGAQPTIHHRSADFPPIFDRCQKALREAFRTESPVAVLASSGTGALEAAMVSTVSPGETVVCVSSGKFGQRWCQVGKAFGMNVVPLEVEWGRAVTPEQIADALKNNPGTKAVVVVQTETSTGAVNPIEAIAAITRNTDTLLIVDAVSAFLAEPMKMDEWGVDVVGTGSQKAVMLPPGLGFTAVGPRAQAAMKDCKTPRFYFDLAKYLKTIEKSDVPFTPAVNLFYSLEEALGQVLSDGLEETWARHAILARAGRAAVQAMNVELFADPASVVVTACKAPEGIEGGAIVKALKAMGITIAGGQDHLKGKIFRFATLGYYDAFDAMTIVSALELALGQLNHKYTRGAGAAAALEVLRAYDPVKGWKTALDTLGG